MTNEQKKQILLDLIKIEENGEIFNFTRAERKGFQIWVEGLINQQESLEQENVLGKIRAEIENHCGLVKENHCKYCSYCNSVMGVREILEIIDKLESKPQESENI